MKGESIIGGLQKIIIIIITGKGRLPSSSLPGFHFLARFPLLTAKLFAFKLIFSSWVLVVAV